MTLSKPPADLAEAAGLHERLRRQRDRERKARREAESIAERATRDLYAALGKLQVREAQLAEAQAVAHLGSWEWNVTSDQVVWSEELFRIFGLDPATDVASIQSFVERIHPEDRALVEHSIGNQRQHAAPLRIEYRVVKPNGELSWVEARAQVIADERGAPVRLVGTAHDITRYKAIQEELRALSLVDELTGLYNRRGFVTLGAQQLKVARRLARSSMLLFIDVDGLKDVNDRDGHAAGDALILAAARSLSATFRQSDVTARLGGDEFAILALDVADASTAVPALRLQKTIEARNAAAPMEPPLQVSVGALAVPSDSEQSIEALLMRADALMYEEKRSRVSARSRRSGG